jgi:hypothetical protein
VEDSCIEARTSGVVFSRSPTMIGSNELAILYSTPHGTRMEPTFDLSGKILQIVKLNLGVRDLWTMRFGSQMDKFVTFNSSNVETLVISVPNATESTLSVSSGSVSGSLCPNRTFTPFPLPSPWNVYLNAYFIPDSTRTRAATLCESPNATFSSILSRSVAILPTADLRLSLTLDSAVFCPSFSAFSERFHATALPVISSSSLSLSFTDSPVGDFSQLMSSSPSLFLFSSALPQSGLSSSSFSEQTVPFEPSFGLTPPLVVTSGISSASGSGSSGLLIGVAVGIVLVITAVICGFLWRWKWRVKSNESSSSDYFARDVEFVGDTLDGATGDTTYHTTHTLGDSSLKQSLLLNDDSI